MKIMAVDFGDARTGLAVCDPTEFLASPVGIIKEKNFLKAAQQIADAAKQHGAQMLVVGLPKKYGRNRRYSRTALPFHGRKTARTDRFACYHVG